MEKHIKYVKPGINQVIFKEIALGNFLLFYSSENREIDLHIYNYFELKAHESESTENKLKNENNNLINKEENIDKNHEKNNNDEEDEDKVLKTEERLKLEEDYENSNILFEIKRRFKCDLMWKRKLDAEILTSTGILLGKICEPEGLFKEKVFEVYDETDNLRFKISSPFMQLGICWRSSIYGKCLEVNFSISVFKTDENKYEDLDGLIIKRFSACTAEDELPHYPDSMEVIYPTNINEKDKFFLTLCGLYMDYRLYEMVPSN